MIQQKSSQLRRLMHRAKEEPKHNIYVYEWYKKLISDLSLSSVEYENAIYTLSNILRV
jgi:hypothetical protein